MSGNKPVTTQIITKKTLATLYKAAEFFANDSDNIDVDRLLLAIDSQVKPPFQMLETATPDLVLNIGPLFVANTETDITRAISPIVDTIPTFTSGTVTFPSSSGGNAVPSVGSNLAITISVGNFLKVGINIDVSGNIVLNTGIEGASEAAATNPKPVPSTFAVGYVTLENVAGTIQNITNDRIVQYIGGSGGGSAAAIEFNLLDNQVVAQDVTDFLLDSAENLGFSADMLIRRYHRDGLVEDSNFYPNITPGANSFVHAATEQSDGKLLVGGVFTSFGGNSRNRLVRLNSDGTEDTAFYTNLGTGFSGGSGVVDEVTIQSDGKILVGGDFTTFNGNTRNNLVRLNSDGTEDSAFYTNLGTGFSGGSGGGYLKTSTITIQSDGKILVGGDFTTFNGNTRNRLVRLNSDGTEDSAFYTNLGTGFNANHVRGIIQQSDSKLVIGGGFTTFNGNTRNNLVRLNSDGTEDTAFYTNLGTGFNATDDFTLFEQSDSKILVGGDFTTFNGNSRNRLVRLNSDGTEDTAFYTNTENGVNNTVMDFTELDNGKIVVTGFFIQNGNGDTRNRIVILNSNGSEDDFYATDFGTGFDGLVFGSTLHNNKLTVFGVFSNFNGNSRNQIMQFDEMAHANLNKQFQLRGYYDSSEKEWNIGESDFIGGDAGITFSMTSAGQLQYTSTDLEGTIQSSVLRYILRRL